MNYYPHHIGDFRSGTVHMTRLERWIYRDMIDLYYDMELPLPLDLDHLYAEIGVRTDEEKGLVQGILRYKFKQGTDGWHHLRCDEEIAKYHAKAEKAKQNGKLGGRPPTGKQTASKSKPEITNPVSLANQDLTGSQANQEPRTNNQEPKNKNKSKADLPDWLPRDSWHGFSEMRKRKGKPMTERAQALILKTLKSLKEGGHDVGAILDKSTINSWTDVYAPKPDQRGAQSPQSRHSGFDELDYREGVTADGQIV